MKNTKICPKCGGDDILKIPGMGPYGRNNSHIKTGHTAFSDILTDRFACCKCGYSEEWINTGEISDLKKLFG